MNQAVDIYRVYAGGDAVYAQGLHLLVVSVLDDQYHPLGQNIPLLELLPSELDARHDFLTLQPQFFGKPVSNEDNSGAPIPEVDALFASSERNQLKL